MGNYLITRSVSTKTMQSHEHMLLSLLQREMQHVATYTGAPAQRSTEHNYNGRPITTVLSMTNRSAFFSSFLLAVEVAAGVIIGLI